MFEEIFEEELGRSSVFKDPGKLSPDYVPRALVHREEEFRQLVRFFKPVVENQVSQRVLITGNVGVGKTALALRFGEELKRAARGRGLALDYLHVNCRKQGTPHAMLSELVQHYNPRWPSRGLGPEKLLDMVVEYLEKHNAYLALTLDEVDSFIRLNGPDMLYSLTRAGEERGGPNRVSIIAIARSRNFLHALDAPTQSTFMHNVIELSNYTAPQLVDILNYRAGEALRAGALGEETIPLIADIAARWGDARFALELLWRAGVIADGEGSELVTPEHVRRAKAEIHPEIRREVLLDLDLHERLILLAIARRLKVSRRAYALTGEVKGSYRVVCEERGEEPLEHTQFWQRARRLEGLGLVDLQLSPKKHRGRTQRVSIPDVPVALLEKELEGLLA